MKSSFLRSWLRLALVSLVVALPVGMRAADAAGAATYAKAVKEYLAAAQQQLKDVREQADNEVKRGGEAAKQRYMETYFGLDRCDLQLEQLKVAPSSQFDYIKANFEASRGDMIKKLEAARKAE